MRVVSEQLALQDHAPGRACGVRRLRVVLDSTRTTPVHVLRALRNLTPKVLTQERASRLAQP